MFLDVTIDCRLLEVRRACSTTSPCPIKGITLPCFFHPFLLVKIGSNMNENCAPRTFLCRQGDLEKSFVTPSVFFEEEEEEEVVIMGRISIGHTLL